MSTQEPQGVPEQTGSESAVEAERTIRDWRTAAASWRSRVTMLPAVGAQPTKVFIDLSQLHGVEITTFRLIQTDPALSESLFVLANNPLATQAFTGIARLAADHTDALATQLELARIDSSKACLLASELRKHPDLPTSAHISLFDDVDVLSRRLEAKLRGGGSAQDQPHPMKPTPVDAVGRCFYDLALSTLDDAKSLITFRRNREAHPEWEALSRTIPSRLTAAVDEWRQALQDDIIAKHELKEARGGRFCNEWIEPMRRDRDGTVRALEARAERAQDRLRDAAKVTSDTQNERSRAENAVAAGWLRERVAAFKVRLDAYVAALAVREQAIEAQRSGAYVLRGWKDTCACTVLREVGRVIAEVEDTKERQNDWWGTNCLSERFNDLDEAAWKDLRIDVKQEAAKLGVHSPRASSDPTSNSVHQDLGNGSHYTDRAKEHSRRREVVHRFHRSIRDIVSQLRLLSRLIAQPNEVGIALMHFDQSATEPPADKDAAAVLAPWCAVRNGIRACLREGNACWADETSDGEPWLRLLFATTGVPPVEMGPLHEPTMHRLLLVAGQAIMDPEADGNVPQYALDSIGVHDGMNVRGVVRMRVVRELVTAKIPSTADHNLEREYGLALERLNDGAAHLALPTPARPAVSRMNKHADAGGAQAFNFRKSSANSVTAVVRALSGLRGKWPESKPTQEAIKNKAGVRGGAGDRAIECATRNKLITPDFLLTKLGEQFLAERT